MASQVLIDAADAVVAAINAAEAAGDFNVEGAGDDSDFEPTFTAVRTWNPSIELADDDTIHVEVLPFDEKIKVLTRDKKEHELFIRVGVRRKFPTTTEGVIPNSEIDPYVILCNKIRDLLDYQTLNMTPAAKWVDSESVTQPVDYEYLEQYLTFAHVFELKFKAFA